MASPRTWTYINVTAAALRNADSIDGPSGWSKSSALANSAYTAAQYSWLLTSLPSCLLSSSVTQKGLRRLLHFHTAYHQDSCELNFKNNNKNSKSPCLPPNEDLEGQQSEVEESFLSLKRGSGSSCTHRVEPISLKHVMGVDCTERKHPTAS